MPSRSAPESGALPASLSVATTEPGPTSTSRAVPRPSASARCLNECFITLSSTGVSTCIRQCRIRFGEYTYRVGSCQGVDALDLNCVEAPFGSTPSGAEEIERGADDGLGVDP